VHLVRPAALPARPRNPTVETRRASRDLCALAGCARGRGCQRRSGSATRGARTVSERATVGKRVAAVYVAGQRAPRGPRLARAVAAKPGRRSSRQRAIPHRRGPATRWRRLARRYEHPLLAGVRASKQRAREMQPPKTPTAVGADVVNRVLSVEGEDRDLRAWEYPELRAALEALGNPARCSSNHQPVRPPAWSRSMSETRSVHDAAGGARRRCLSMRVVVRGAARARCGRGAARDRATPTRRTSCSAPSTSRTSSTMVGVVVGGEAEVRAVPRGAARPRLPRLERPVRVARARLVARRRRRSALGRAAAADVPRARTSPTTRSARSSSSGRARAARRSTRCPRPSRTKSRRRGTTRSSTTGSAVSARERLDLMVEELRGLVELIERTTGRGFRRGALRE
jgi:hypothetical protein